MVAELFEVTETRRLATFRTVDAVEPIENADAIELAVVGGWKVVTKKGEFAPGDACVYFEIDSFLPDGVAAWQFLVDKSPRMFNGVKGHKLRTIKLRGQISQGLILRPDSFPLLTFLLDPKPLDTVEREVIAETYGMETLEELNMLRFGLYEHEAQLDPRDLNLNKLLGIVKWDPPLSPQLQGMAAGLFPSFIRKTDQERAQNLKAEIFDTEDHLVPVDVSSIPPEALEAMKDKGLLEWVGDALGGKWMKLLPAKADPNARYEVSMKLDGSSMTVFARSQYSEPIRDEDGSIQNPIESGVCSRNLQLKVNEENAENSFVKVATESGLLQALIALAEAGAEMAVQGELMGPAIQGNREELKTFHLYVFDIFDITTGTYLAPAARRTMVQHLRDQGVKISHVPVLHDDVSLSELGLDTMEKLLAYAEGPSIKHPVREGLVYKRADGKFSFKTISNKYLASEKD